MELTISDEQMKDFMKEVIIEMIKEKKDLFYELIQEAIEEVALANAITAGRKDDFVNEEQIFGILES